MGELLKFGLSVIVFMNVGWITAGRHLQSAERNCRCRCAIISFQERDVRPALMPPETFATVHHLFGDYSIVCHIDSPQRRDEIAETAWRLRQAREDAQQRRLYE